MKYVITSRIIKSLALGTVIVMSAANADDVNLKTMIPGVPQIDAEAYILIDYNSGKVLAEMNADTRRNPASLTKMMTSYVIGQAIKSGKIGLKTWSPWVKMPGLPVTRNLKAPP